MRTRAQLDSELAYEKISSLPKDVDHNAYGGLCHHFPMLVLRSGLCQAVAFYTVKACGKTHAAAYRTFLEHMADVADQPDTDHKAFQQRILRMGLSEYQQTTRRILAAAIWYKRFAISHLDVDSPGETS